MDDDVQNLVLAPFQEVAERGKIALENATAAGLTKSDDMFKAAHGLARDGERALKKLEPLCRKQWEEYSTSFVVALKENDEIADFRTELNDLLWDFDSFVEVDDFDASEYSKLRALSSRAAKRIYEILMRMKLEPPPIAFNHFDSAGISRTTSIAGRSAVSDTPLPPPETPDIIEEEETPDPHAVPEPLRVPSTTTASLMAAQAGPDLGYDPDDATRGDQRTASPRDADSRQGSHGHAPPEQESPVIPRQLYAESIRTEDIPPEPLINPWQPTVKPTFSVQVEALDPRPPPDRRRRVSSEDSGRPFTPPFIVSNAFGEPNGTPPRPRRLDEGVEVLIHEESARQATLREPRLSAQPIKLVPSSHRHSQASSTNSGRSSVFDPGARDSMVSPVTDHRVSVADEYNLSPVRTDSYASIPEDRPQAGDQPGLIVAQKAEDQPGLEPVLVGDGSAPGSGGPQPPIILREPNCNLTVDSSFYQLKGFCDGAKDIIRGGVGVKKVRKGGIGAANTLVAKCTNKSCMFELEWQAVEADLNKSDQANYRNTTIGFRLRFISKSHLAASHIDDNKYGCLFCVQLGRTPEESDATVFPNQKALFSHLARHPRPLPPVPGLTVIETPDIPAPFRDNYDLHLPHPPARSLMAGLARELSALPTAVATDSFRRTQLSVLRMPPTTDSSSVGVLQFFAGQRIVGVEFPARFNGEWAVGWADNVRGVFPADCVKLEAPSEIREVMRKMGGGGGGGASGSTTGLRAVARWRRHPKDKEAKEGGWLRFEKGEVISHISFPYAEHWCWYGSNSKGKFGIFPQSHMEPNTLSESPGVGGDGASVISHESKSGAASRMLAQFASIRRRETRPVSSAGSHSSGDTATLHSPRPVYG
ncbi:hypothetical protein GE09DRAFT_971710 [Coniochaeta sp. 2T2.1]|nr:hypothetical protein GE09DRAFT_971710 [Coniochaeta sp. 2T2.1]